MDTLTADQQVEATEDRAGRAAPSDDGSEPEFSGGTRQRVGLFLGATLFALTLLIPAPEGLSPGAQRTAAVAVLMAVWWMTEALPLPATALLPIALFPLLGVMSAGEATAPYANHIIFLFLGGFVLALAMQRWGLHRRIALGVVAGVGTEPHRMVLGFMLATAFLSMWISNTASTVMMLPIGIAILSLLEEDEAGPLGTALMLGIAYAASIGGVATLIGTPPNAILAGAAEELLGITIGFMEWMYVGVPLAGVMLGLCWILLCFVLFRLRAATGASEAADAVIGEQRSALGPMSRGERVVAVVFALTALAWVLRDEKSFGAIEIPGIATFFPLVADSTIAIAGAVLLFVIPISWEQRIFAMNWEWAAKLPWGVLLLFGGGLSLAHGFEETGLSTWIGDQVAEFTTLPLFALIGIIAVLFILLTELTSNTATSTMAMPIMVGVAAGTGNDPLTLMATAALASSMAFMLPVATPPNAIVFGSGRITIPQMVRAGVWLNTLAVVLVSLTAYLLLGVLAGTP